MMFPESSISKAWGHIFSLYSVHADFSIVFLPFTCLERVEGHLWDKKSEQQNTKQVEIEIKYNLN